MRRSAFLAAGILLVAAGCAGDRRETRVARSKPAPFIPWEDPPEAPVEERPVAEAPPPSTCRMWLETTPSGIAVRFEPKDESSLAELRLLSSKLRDVDELGRPAPEAVASASEAESPMEEPPPADEAETAEPDDESESPTAAASTDVAATPPIVERADSEQAAGAIENVETASEAAGMLNAGRAETHGLRAIMAHEPAVSVQPAKNAVRLVFTARDPKQVEPLRASVRWHAADLLPNAAVDDDRNQCVHLPAVVAAGGAGDTRTEN